MNISPKTTRTEITLIYVTGLFQGLALVTFPAASSIFTSPNGYGFSHARYGAMFLPQVSLAILASSLAPKFASRSSLKTVLLLGVFADLVSMSLLASSNLLRTSPQIAFGLLLFSTAALGFGFGSTLMALNTYAERFFPEQSDRAVLLLNALLGTGTALAPLFVAVLLVLGAWWALPIFVASALALILVCLSRQPLKINSSGNVVGGTTAFSLSRLPSRFWLYAAIVFLYGIVETLNGNWAALYLTTQRGESAQSGTLALTSFWAMVTIGRVLFAALSAIVPVRFIYGSLPVLLAVAFQAVSRATSQTDGALAFGLTGLACSAFFPLSMSFGGDEFPKRAAVMSGGLIAFYQVGYGVAAFGIGSLLEIKGLLFSLVYSWGSVVALTMGILVWFLFRKHSSP
jgi:FHS family glucose/mannose:H+ symporter-like MFS transporter